MSKAALRASKLINNKIIEAYNNKSSEEPSQKNEEQAKANMANTLESKLSVLRF